MTLVIFELVQPLQPIVVAPSRLLLDQVARRCRHRRRSRRRSRSWPSRAGRAVAELPVRQEPEDLAAQGARVDGRGQLDRPGSSAAIPARRRSPDDRAPGRRPDGRRRRAAQPAPRGNGDVQCAAVRRMARPGCRARRGATAARHRRPSSRRRARRERDGHAPAGGEGDPVVGVGDGILVLDRGLDGPPAARSRRRGSPSRRGRETGRTAAASAPAGARPATRSTPRMARRSGWRTRRAAGGRGRDGNDGPHRLGGRLDGSPVPRGTTRRRWSRWGGVRCGPVRTGSVQRAVGAGRCGSGRRRLSSPYDPELDRAGRLPPVLSVTVARYSYVESSSSGRSRWPCPAA